MLQEIAPKHLNNQYHPCAIGQGAKICVFRDRDVLVSRREDEVILPDWELLKDEIVRSVYLFSVDSEPYFLAELKQDAVLPEGFMYDNVRSHRKLKPRYTVYAEMTAWHLYYGIGITVSAGAAAMLRRMMRNCACCNALPAGT